MAEANSDRPADTALVFRMGLHLGDPIVDDQESIKVAGAHQPLYNLGHA